MTSAEEHIMCPVCWISSNDSTADEGGFAKTPCNHVYCRTCIERVLLPDIATSGTCPMCRTAVSIFDLRNAVTEDALYPSNSDVSCWPIANTLFEQFPVRRGGGFQPLQRDGIFRETSFCFRQGIPKLQYTTSAELDSENVQTVDFQRYHFHPSSMTFHGRIDFHDPIIKPCGDSMCYTYSSFNCILQFSTCGNYIRDGYIHWIFQATSSDEYPLDGKWRVEWEPGESIEIHLQKHCFSCMGINYEITFDEDNCPKFEWPVMHAGSGIIVQRTKQQIAPGTHGPSVGETLEWSTDLPSFSKIVWKRVSMGLSPQSGRRLRIRPDQFVYRSADFKPQLPQYVASSIWGNTYCQMYTVGLASYHFEETTDEDSVDYRAYISYEHPHTEVWPALDNGEKVPDRVPFRNIEWDSNERIFKGDICWEEEYSTTWMGEDFWHYEIEFDPTFIFIKSGTCTRSNSQEPHQFGQDLVYVNAGLEGMLSGLKETITTTGEYLDVVRKWRQAGASGPTLEMLGEVSMRVLDNQDESVFDFNLYR